MPATVPAIFDFSVEYQRRVLTLCMKDPDFLIQIIDITDPESFESEAHKRIFRLCRGYVDKYHVPPTIGVMWEEIQRTVKAEAIRTVLEEELMAIRKEPVQDREYVLDRVRTFVRHQAMKAAILESVDLLEQGEYDRVAEVTQNALRVGVEKDLGSDYFKDAQLRAAHRKDVYDNPCPTFLGGLDKFLGGGLRAKELGVILGPPGRGKSVALVNIGKAAIYNKFPVVHYTLEMSAQKIGTRYDSCITGHPVRELYQDDPQRDQAMFEKLQKMRDAYKASLTIKEFPTGSASVNDIEAHLRMLETTGIKVGLVIVDYADIMRATREYNERRFELAQIYAELRGLAVRRSIPVFTASQANRSALSKRTFGMEEVSESFDKAMVADVIVALCQDKDDVEKGIMRLHIAKNRDGISGASVVVNTDLPRMMLARVGSPGTP